MIGMRRRPAIAHRPSPHSATQSCIPSLAIRRPPPRCRLRHEHRLLWRHRAHRRLGEGLDLRKELAPQPLERRIAERVAAEPRDGGLQVATRAAVVVVAVRFRCFGTRTCRMELRRVTIDDLIRDRALGLGLERLPLVHSRLPRLLSRGLGRPTYCEYHQSLAFVARRRAPIGEANSADLPGGVGASEQLWEEATVEDPERQTRHQPLRELQALLRNAIPSA